MDIFKLDIMDSSLFMNGTIIQDATSKRWTERYAEAGEFELIGPLSAGWRDSIPEGSFLSHLGTQEVMIVENHEFTLNEIGDPIIKVTGRSLETYLEQRPIGMNQAGASPAVDSYDVSADYAWKQAQDLINNHIYTTYNTSFDLHGLVRANAQSGIAGTSEARTIAFGNVYRAVLDILGVDGLGIKSIRKSNFGIDYSDPAITYLHVHAGESKVHDVIFSIDKGDLESEQYFFSQRKFKNSALVIGRYVWVITGYTGYGAYTRQFATVDAQDIDGRLSAMPTGAALASIQSKMRVRGKEALLNQRRISLAQVDVSNRSRYIYRKDYDIGDLVTIDGIFNRATMRVVEFTEIQDENGSSAHPILEFPAAAEELE